MNCKANKCIECTVQQCAYHCENTHEANPTENQCTDCKSFRKK